MRANPLQGSLEGVDPENRDFLGPDMATSEAKMHKNVKNIEKKNREGGVLGGG